MRLTNDILTAWAGNAMLDRKRESGIGWCIVTDIRESDPDDMPMVFSSNLVITNLAESLRFFDKSPLGRTVVVMLKGQSICVVSQARCEELFRDHRIDRKVIRPRLDY